MKKVFAVLLCLLIGCSVLCAPAAQAQEETGTLISQEVEYLADGSKIVTCVYEDDVNQGIATAATTVTKSGKKTQTVYNSDNEVIFTLTVHGTFSVIMGNSCSCTASSYSYTTPGSGWSLKTGSATKSANKAYANGTFVKKILGITTQTENASVTLTCSINGVLS